MRRRARADPRGRPSAAARGADLLPLFDGSLLSGALLEAIVRPHDPGDELMAHDVALVEVDEADPIDALEYLARDDEAAPVAGKIDLRDVPGDDRLRTEAEPRKEHLHLLGRRVLG